MLNSVLKCHGKNQGYYRIPVLSGSRRYEGWLLKIIKTLCNLLLILFQRKEEISMC